MSSENYRDATRCPQCGRPLRVGSPEGLCAHCLARVSFGLLGEFFSAGSPQSLTDMAWIDAALPRPAHSPATGFIRARFGDYERLEEIGRGGMGVVYRARQKSLNRVVALKMIPFGNLATEEAVRRFRAEAEAAAHLQHPNIVAIHEVGQEDGQHYFSMEYIEGHTLAELLRQGPLPARRAAEYLETVAQAVHYAHQRGILHRDLKPSNILLDQNNEPHIADFGLARRLTGDSTLTLTGQLLGSPGYIPPEQALGQHQALSPRSDLYSLGAVLYHALTGRPPFQGDSLESVLGQLTTKEPVAPRLLNPNVPRDLETVCLKCLAKEPKRRYASTQELADELGRFLRHEPVLAKPVGFPEKILRWCRRKPALAATLVVLHLVFLVGALGVLWQWRRAEATAAVLRQDVYAADMEAAFRAFQGGDLAEARRLLDRYSGSSPAAGGAALRQWEWRYLWQQCHLAEQFTLDKLPGTVRAVEFSGDSRWLAAGGVDGTFKVWDVATRQSVLATNVSHHRINDLVFAPDRLRAAILTESDGVYLWDVAASTVRNIIYGPDPEIGASFTTNGSILATTTGGPVQVWDLKGKKQIAGIDTTTNHWPTRLAFSTDDHTLAIGDGLGVCYLWDWHTQLELESWLAHAKPFPGEPSSPLSVVFSPDCKMLATAGMDTDVRVWGIPGHRLLSVLTQAQAKATSPHFVLDGRALLTCSSNLQLRLWDTGTWRPLPAPALPVSAFRVGVSPDGRWLASGGLDGAVQLWEANTNLESQQIMRLPEGVEVQRLHESARAVSLAADPQIWRVWDLDARREISTGSIPPELVCYILLEHRLPECQFVGYTTNQTLELWDAKRQRLESFASAQLGVPAVLAVSRDGALVAAGGPQRVGVWDLRTRRQLRSWDFPSDKGQRALELSGDGAFVVTASQNGRVYRLDVLTGATNALPGPARGCSGLALARNDQRLALVGGTSTLTVYDTRRCEEIASWNNGPDLAVTSVTFTPDANRLAAGTAGGRIQLWDVEAQREVARLAGHPGPVHALGFMDDETLVSVAYDGVRYWRAPTLENIQRKAIATRPGSR